MLEITRWVVPPMIVGALMGATLQRGVAHACDCTYESWSLELDRVESTDPAINEDHVWPGAGHLNLHSLALSQEGHTFYLGYE